MLIDIHGIKIGILLNKEWAVNSICHFIDYAAETKYKK